MTKKCRYCGSDFNRRGTKAIYCNRECYFLSDSYRKMASENAKKTLAKRIRKPFRMERNYKMFLIPNHPMANKQGYLYEHRLVMSNYLGRYLTTKEVVHHINENQSDNRIENLELTNRHEHMKRHQYYFDSLKKMKDISKEELYENYHIKNMTLEQLGILYKCSGVCVSNKLKKYGLNKGRGINKFSKIK